MSQGESSAGKRVPIRRRVLTVVLLTTLIGILAASITGFLCINWVKSTSEEALTHQLEDNLKSIVTQKAVLADAKLEHYEKYIEFTTDYIEKMYGDEERMIEFVVVLKGRDYHNIEVLAARFKDKIEAISSNDQLDPWERVSAAIGYALYDEKLDANVESVLARADREMYEHKRAMKQVES